MEKVKGKDKLSLHAPDEERLRDSRLVKSTVPSPRELTEGDYKYSLLGRDYTQKACRWLNPWKMPSRKEKKKGIESRADGSLVPMNSRHLRGSHGCGLPGGSISRK